MALLHSICSPAFYRCSPDSPSASLKGSCLVGKVAGLCVSGRRLVVYAVSAPHCIRRPTLPPAGLLSKPTTLVSERLLCTDVQHRRKLELRYAKHSSKDFCEFIETTPKAELVAFFRDIAEELEGYRQLKDFHLKIRNDEGDFRVEVFSGDEERRGPEVSPDAACIACFPDANLFLGQEPGMEAGECILEEFSDRPYALCRLDPKGRSGFSITPVRHVERMSELDDNELFSLLNVAVRTIRQIDIPFISMIMNHGTYRTLYHLNLKIWVDSEMLEQYRSTWSGERKGLWDRLQKYAMNRPRKQQICFFYRKDGWCRHGDMCSFSHGE